MPEAAEFGRIVFGGTAPTSRAIRERMGSSGTPFLQSLGEAVALGGGQVALVVAALERLAQQVGGRAVRGALGDGGGRGDCRHLLPPADLLGSEILMMDNVVVATDTTPASVPGDGDVDQVGVVTSLIPDARAQGRLPAHVPRWTSIWTAMRPAKTTSSARLRELSVSHGWMVTVADEQSTDPGDPPDAA